MSRDVPIGKLPSNPCGERVHLLMGGQPTRPRAKCEREHIHWWETPSIPCTDTDGRAFFPSHIVKTEWRAISLCYAMVTDGRRHGNCRRPRHPCGAQGSFAARSCRQAEARPVSRPRSAERSEGSLDTGRASAGYPTTGRLPFPFPTSPYSLRERETGNASDSPLTVPSKSVITLTKRAAAASSMTAHRAFYRVGLCPQGTQAVSFPAP